MHDLGLTLFIIYYPLPTVRRGTFDEALTLLFFLTIFANTEHHNFRRVSHIHVFIIKCKVLCLSTFHNEVFYQMYDSEC